MNPIEVTVSDLSNQKLFIGKRDEILADVIPHFLKYGKPKRLSSSEFNSVEAVLALQWLCAKKWIQLTKVDHHYYMDYTILPTKEGIAQTICNKL